MARLIANQGEISVEGHSNFQKQTIRNRCEILGVNGKMRLTVPLSSWSTHRPLNEIRIDNSANWRNIHLRAIRTAYGNSPYFDHYIPDLEETLAKEYGLLMDLDVASMELVLKWVGVDQNLKILESEPFSDVLDLRHIFSKKHRWLDSIPPYLQVFSDRHDFQPNLSILDLMFNQGPKSILYLEKVAKMAAD